jgi:two-component system LytT family response regulator
MNKIKILIVDDEEQGRNAVQQAVKKYCPHLEIVALADSKEDAVIKIELLKPNILLLDIHLGDGTGFDVLKEISYSPKVIFITAFDNFAVNAFRFNAIDYLLKPFDPLELVEALGKSLNLLSSESGVIPEKELLHFQAEKVQKLVIPSNSGFEVIELANISYLKADNNYTHIYLINNERKMLSKTLKYFEELLTDSGFFRCHQSFMIRLDQIKEYTKGEGGTLILHSGAQIEVSRRKKEELMEQMKHIFIR